MTEDKSNLQRSAFISRQEILDARQRVSSHLSPSPLVRSQYYSDLVGADVSLKLECLQPTHTFKVRGAINAILSLPESKRKRGVVTASGGNHGLGVAFASRICGAPATIFLPVRTPQIKVEAIKRLGAEVVLHGEAWDEANAHATVVAREQDKAYIHPFDDPLVMAGQGTIVCELMEQIAQPDLIIASIGGGGLISGIASAVAHFLPDTGVAGVETDGADCMSRSMKEGEIVELPAITSIADSLGAKRTGERQFKIVSAAVSQLVTVDDRSAVEAGLEILKEEKLLTEPAAACCIAALKHNKLAFPKGARIVVVVCGANISLDRLLAWKKEFSID